ncbi:hypothetical protein DICPUDRAFT_153086 [Dictyostelium purpureum]|uniref:PDZ domain-containing protein n=1 Tax=Dictyostelium purpureum TaxID=5786 RepID=F0ZN09_DICPU|nr:uncharacterized protein DICPUDRAFT_153086 [Dictyostelium purpureum]EGC34675.1 hypothetical protein DICPUDRAFT_153086 [Dictyostelium purpureum]|eukprot:XP_003288812.1 hypothetical protein DICPUDRAFT_153086 [Dictyostelium purpureum]
MIQSTIRKCFLTKSIKLPIYNSIICNNSKPNILNSINKNSFIINKNKSFYSTTSSNNNNNKNETSLESCNNIKDKDGNILKVLDDDSPRNLASTGLVEALLPKKQQPDLPLVDPISQASSNTIELSDQYSDPLLDPIVKVFSVLTSPNHFIPWQMKPQREVTGSGFIISGRRILTNAHVVADQTLVMVTKFGNPNKFPAKLISSAHEYDLAMLTVEDDEFWKDIVPLEMGDLPDLQDTVTVVGFPTGGSNICVTQGVVSRIDLQPYAHSEIRSLSIQIDAAINPGNSGGPALKDGKVVGIAFQNLAGASSIGFIIPTPVVRRFIRDIELNGKFTGVPMLGIISQNLDSMPKDYFKIPASSTGVVVNELHPFSGAKNAIKIQDIITHINGVSLADDGSIAFRRRERISFEYLFSSHFIGDKIDITVLRDGERLNLQVPLVNQHRVVPFQMYDSRPSYFVYSGLVFVPITYPFLLELSEDLAVTYRRIYERIEKITSEDFQVVILSQVLFDKTNHGYSNLSLCEVKKVNGVPVRNLKHLVQLIESNENKYLVITLEHENLIILDKDEAQEANVRVMSQHAIPHLKSLDLRLLEQNNKKEEILEGEITSK